MMKLIPILLAFSSTAALANSCPDVYECKSASGRYQISLSHCHANNLGTHPGIDPDSEKGFLLLLDGKKQSDASLGAAWDGDTVVAFELSLPNLGDKEQLLSAELSRKTLKGTIRYKTRDSEPGPFQTIRSEAISCQDD
jgi:hypothetical protein